MNKDRLQAEKKQLEQQREQLIAQINQITGAVAMIDKMLNELVEEVDKDSDVEEIKEEKIELKKAA